MSTALKVSKDKSRSTAPGSYLTNPGGFVVEINEVVWGRITTDSHGPRGMSYTLQQWNGTRFVTCQEKIKDKDDKIARYSTVRIFSDKLYLRNLRAGEKPIPFEHRIRFMIMDAIKKGILRDPVAVIAEIKKLTEANRKKEADSLQRAEERWRNKADEVIGPIKFAVTRGNCDALRARIIEAMKWAQTK